MLEEELQEGGVEEEKSTGIGGDMVGGTSVEIPFVLGGC
jgi:hypothetical protein